MSRWIGADAGHTMTMPHHQIDVAQDADGMPVVSVVVDLSAEQIKASAHAVRVARDVRYRTPELSTDEVLAMRELTSLADELAERQGHEGHARMVFSVARLAALREGLDAFCEARGEDIVREGDADALPAARALTFELADVQAEAVRIALAGVPCPR